jgi:D-cysteine desulfhydrase
VGVVVNDQLRLDHGTVMTLATRTARLLRRRGATVPEPDPDALLVVRDWLGAGYGHPTPEAVDAQDVAAAEGLTLEPVYTAKALAALRERNADGRLGDGPVLFLNTNGPR